MGGGVGEGPEPASSAVGWKGAGARARVGDRERAERRGAWWEGEQSIPGALAGGLRVDIEGQG